MLQDENKPVRFAEWNEKEVEVLNKHLFLTSKPQVRVAFCVVRMVFCTDICISVHFV